MGDVSGNERKVFKEKSWLSLGSNTPTPPRVLSPVLGERKPGLHQEQAQRAGPSVAPPVCQPNKVPQVVKHMGCGNDGVWGEVLFIAGYTELLKTPLTVNLIYSESKQEQYCSELAQPIYLSDIQRFILNRELISNISVQYILMKMTINCYFNFNLKCSSVIDKSFVVRKDVYIIQLKPHILTDDGTSLLLN